MRSNHLQIDSSSIHLLSQIIIDADFYKIDGIMNKVKCRCIRNLHSVKTFTDILFFKSSTNILQLLQKGRTLAGTAGYTQTIAQYQSIWTSFSSVSAIFFEHLKDLWFRVLTQITGLMRIDNVSKKNFEEFVVYFNSILNSYQMAGVNFWSSILAQSLKHVGKKQSLKKIIQGIVVRNF
jgi:hypothetical protein